MASITINDLEDSRELDKEALANVSGGYYYWLYQPAYSYYFNPFVYSMQSSWASAGASFDASHNNFIDFLRS